MRAIYALCHPHTGALKYIGQTKNPDQRLRGHINEAKSMPPYPGSRNWIKSILPLLPVMRLLFVVDDSLSNAAEIEAIKTAKACGHRLTNRRLCANGRK